MKNLESFGVQELSAKEICQTDGGFDATNEGMITGYVFARILKRFVESFLPF